MKIRSTFEQSHWLISRRGDFWLACGGASVTLLASLPVIVWYGDRELDALDFLLSEFHLGATYDAIVRRRLWRQRQIDVVLIPLSIIALTYALWMNGHTILLTSIAMYAAVWHRGRQSLGVARFYQSAMGGAVSRAHNVLFRGAIYLPMLAATLAYTHWAPAQYDGEPYLALNLGAHMASTVCLAAVLWVLAYGAWTFRRNNAVRPIQTTRNPASEIHPGESWVVLAHAVAFGSGYVLGASSASFLLVLAVHHEVQYLYFTYAMARRPGALALGKTDVEPVVNQFDPNASQNAGPPWRAEVKFAAFFFLWPVVGFSGAVVGTWLQLGWLAPLGMGGLFCHYWLDGRIWTRPSFRN